MKATCSFPITGRRGAKVVTSICLKGFLSAEKESFRACSTGLGEGFADLAAMRALLGADPPGTTQ